MGKPDFSVASIHTPVFYTMIRRLSTPHFYPFIPFCVNRRSGFPPGERNTPSPIFQSALAGVINHRFPFEKIFHRISENPLHFLTGWCIIYPNRCAHSAPAERRVSHDRRPADEHSLFPPEGACRPAGLLPAGHGCLCMHFMHLHFLHSKRCQQQHQHQHQQQHQLQQQL